jgi:hypothetical protein
MMHIIGSTIHAERNTGGLVGPEACSIAKV